MTDKPAIVEQDPWQQLKSFTNARIAIGHVGGSLPLSEVLRFNAAYATAKDAIQISLDQEKIISSIKADNPAKINIHRLKTKVRDRGEYLKRPDLGTRLATESKNRLMLVTGSHTEQKNIALIITDGLSAQAVNTQVAELVNLLIKDLPDFDLHICLTEQGRVAICDEIGELLQSEMAVVMIGERPGLSSPQSMGIYTTYAPRHGLTNESRNCISNVHEDGLSIFGASQMLLAMINASLSKRMSGVSLKFEPIQSTEANQLNEPGN